MLSPEGKRKLTAAVLGVALFLLCWGLFLVVGTESNHPSKGSIGPAAQTVRSKIGELPDGVLASHLGLLLTRMEAPKKIGPLQMILLGRL